MSLFMCAVYLSISKYEKLTISKRMLIIIIIIISIKLLY